MERSDPVGMLAGIPTNASDGLDMSLAEGLPNEAPAYGTDDDDDVDDVDDDGAGGGGMDRLQVPVNKKQWLISPPSSPPVGWVQELEDPPVCNPELVEALMGLDPLAQRELHAASAGRPSITVVLADDTDSAEVGPTGKRLPMTSMPPPYV